ncbi:MAG TPA: DUF5107 domain-containing protein [Anaerolineales bacterium]|nr:DUF5107 domain-containing protein [Anaerolineales bacterium]
MEVRHVVYEGLNALEMQNQSVRIVILPEWGGKIASLYDKRRGREWLNINRSFSFRLPTYDAIYVRDFDIGGFDECFPNIGAGPYPNWPWLGAMLPDHGEAGLLPARGELSWYLSIFLG